MVVGRKYPGYGAGIIGDWRKCRKYHTVWRVCDMIIPMDGQVFTVTMSLEL